MSIEAMAWALDATGADGTPLAPAEKLALLGIASHADRDGGNAWPSMQTLAGYVGRSVVQTRRIVHALVEHELLTIEQQKGGTADTPADRRPNRYTVHMRGRGLSPMRGRDLSPVRAEPSKEPSKEPSPRSRRRTERDDYFDVLVEVYGQPTRSGAAFYARVVADVIAMPDASPDELRKRAIVARQRYGPKSTAAAVTKHWPLLGDQTPRQAEGSKWDRLAEADRRRLAEEQRMREAQ